MTRREQQRFIRELCRNVQKELIEDSRKFPADWDGHELRELIARRFRRAVFGDGLTGSRKREFENTLLVVNL